jgi:hypothetical protein
MSDILFHHTHYVNGHCLHSGTAWHGMDWLYSMLDRAHEAGFSVSVNFYVSPLSYTVFCDFQVDTGEFSPISAH